MKDTLNRMKNLCHFLFKIANRAFGDVEEDHAVHLKLGARIFKNQCEKADVKFFFKQWSGTNKKKTGRELNGKTWNEMPEFPEMFSK